MVKAEYKRDQVVTIISSVLEKIERTQPVPLDVVNEIRDLHDLIQQTRADLAQARPQDINGTMVPNATDELDEVVEETAKATDAIMDACDVMQSLDIPEPYKSAVVDQVTKIYEACSFQDITGQRIRKVVRTLRDIEGRIDNLLVAFPAGEGEKDAVKESGSVSPLLNGPQLGGQGVSQDEIDKLLASFD